MSEAEKHGWVNPENPKRGDKPKAVMVPYVGDPSLQQLPRLREEEFCTPHPEALKDASGRASPLRPEIW